MRTASIKIGLWMLAGFIAFFLLLHVMGLSQRTDLLLFIGVIHLFFIYRAIKMHYKLYPEEVGNYMSGVARGMEASVIGVGGFTAFIGIFLSLNPAFMTSIRENSNLAPYLTPFTTSLFILTQGLIVSLIGSYIITRILDISIKKQDV